MSSEDDRLHLVKLRMDTRGLFEIARRRRLPLREPDSGYLAHCGLKEIFGEIAPTPFTITGKMGRFTTLLGYASSSDEELTAHALTYAEPEAYRNCDWSGLASKELPRDFPVGRQLSFATRACPVVRKASDGAHHKKGAEVDVFLSRCWEAGGPEVTVSREEVYREWLAENIERTGGARVLSSSVRSFKLEKLLRRTHEDRRKSHLIERPDVLFSGVLEVRDPAAFRALLRRGIGRHRAFGFGMILLRRRA